MVAWWLTVLVGASSLAEARGALAHKDWPKFAALRAEHLQSGGSVAHGAWGHLEDVSRLLRCLELDRIVLEREDAPWKAHRALIRLEAARLRRHRFELAYPQASFAALFFEKKDEVKKATDAIVWPLQAQEIWPDERPKITWQGSACLRSKADESLIKSTSAARKDEERLWLGRVLDLAASLPREAEERVWMKATELGSVPRTMRSRMQSPSMTAYGAYAQWRMMMQGKLSSEVLIDAADEALQTAATVQWVHALHQKSSQPRLRLSLAERVQERIRGRSGQAAMRDWLLYVESGAHLDLAEAGQGEFAQIDRLGATLSVLQSASPALEAAWSNLYRAQLARAVEPALAALVGYGDRSPRAVRARWMELSRWAVRARKLSYARQVLDRLWLEATKQAPWPKDAARIAGYQASVVLELNDAARFAYWVDVLFRFGPSPVKTQTFLALVQTAAVKLDALSTHRAPFAARLVQGLKVIEDEQRLARRYIQLRQKLTRWAGPYVDDRRPSRTKNILTPEILASVSVPRPRADLSPPSVAVAKPPLDALLVWFDEAEQAHLGLPASFRR